MTGLKLLVLIGQVGRIWSRHRTEVKIFQTIAAGAFFALYLKKNLNRDEQNEYTTFKQEIK